MRWCRNGWRKRWPKCRPRAEALRFGACPPGRISLHPARVSALTMEPMEPKRRRRWAPSAAPGPGEMAARQRACLCAMRGPACRAAPMVAAANRGRPGVISRSRDGNRPDPGMPPHYAGRRPGGGIGPPAIADVVEHEGKGMPRGRAMPARDYAWQGPIRSGAARQGPLSAGSAMGIIVSSSRPCSRPGDDAKKKGGRFPSLPNSQSLRTGLA